MIHFKKQLLGFAALVTFFMIALASSSSQQVHKTGNGKKLPDDFNLSSYTLLVEKLKKENLQQVTEAYMNEKYPYKYKFVSKEDIYDGSGVYDDTTMYKYALVSTVMSTTTSATKEKSTFSYMIYDRTAEHSYVPFGTGYSDLRKAFKYGVDYVLKNAKK